MKLMKIIGLHLYLDEPQTTGVILYTNINNIETPEAMPPTKITETSLLTSSTLISGISIPLQVPSKNSSKHFSFS